MVFIRDTRPRKYRSLERVFERDLLLRAKIRSFATVEARDAYIKRWDGAAGDGLSWKVKPLSTKQEDK